MQAADRPLVIAHRGASGYLPEHTLAAKAAAFAMGADYIEQDVVLSKDDVPIVLHDIHLESVTNVAELFPQRCRADKRYYAIDFTLAEIRQLSVHERTDRRTGEPAFPRRFPVGKSAFSIPTLAEEIEMIQGMNRASGRTVGIYPELKQPEFHRKEGRDLATTVLKLLKRYGYSKPTDPCFLQCFDRAEVRRVRRDLGCRLRVVQLTRHEKLSDADLRDIAQVAEGLGPSLAQVIDFDAAPPQITDLVRRAHAAGLDVHPWTLRADQVPKQVENFAALHALLLRAKVDGGFSDFPDQTLRLWKK